MPLAVPVFTLSFLIGISFAKDSPKTVVKPPKDSVKAVLAPACSVARMAFAMRVDETREPIGEAKVFPAAVQKIYCWTQLDCGDGPVSLKHIWYKDGMNMGSISITAKSGHSRVATRKTITAGAWRVEVIKDSAQVIGTGEVTIK